MFSAQPPKRLKFHQRHGHVKITAAHHINTFKHVRGTMSIPVITDQQDHLSAETMEEFSDPDCNGERDDKGHPAWSRLSSEVQITIPPFDLSVTNDDGSFDDVISAVGATIFQPSEGVAVELTVIVHKTMRVGRDYLQAEMVHKSSDKQHYNGQYCKY